MSQKIVQNDYFAGLHGLKNFNDAQLFMPFLQSNRAKLCAAAIEDGACNLWETRSRRHVAWVRGTRADRAGSSHLYRPVSLAFAVNTPADGTFIRYPRLSKRSDPKKFLAHLHLMLSPPKVVTVLTPARKTGGLLGGGAPPVPAAFVSANDRCLISGFVSGLYLWASLSS